MARSRNIKPAFFVNEQLADVEPLGRILFIGLWTIADREGRLEDRPRKIKVEILPYDDCDVDLLLTELHQKGFIVRYEVEDKKYIWIRKFSKHQNPHIKETQSIIPEYCSQNYPQVYPQTYPQVCPQADQNEKVVLSEEDPDALTATRDSSIPDTSTGNSDSFPADSLILIPDPPTLIPELFKLESGAESNLGSNSGSESESEDEVEVEVDEEASEKPTDTIAGRTGITRKTKTAAAATVEKELGRSLSPLECEQVLNWEKKYGSQLVKEALKIAILKGACRLKFIEAILLEWEKANVRSYHEVLNYELQRKGKGRVTYLTSSEKSLEGLYEL